MKKFTALILAAGLLWGMLCIGASAAGYGRNPHYWDVTAQGEYIYFISGNTIRKMHITDGKQETVCKVIGEEPTCLCIMGNYLYYSASYETDSFDSYDAVYKVEISSGKQTKIIDTIDMRDEPHPYGIITSGNRVYVPFDVFVHEEINDRYYVDIYDANGKYLDNFTPCVENYSFFIDASDCEACAAAEESKIVYTYPDHGDEDEEDWFDDDPEDWHIEYTGAYNIVKIKSDLSEEKIVIPAKIGKKINNFVYCDKKYVYYIEKESDRLCRYNTETEKYTVLVKDGVAAAKYKDGAVYFLARSGDLKKYQKGKVSTVKKSLDGEFGVYFFDDYIVYEYKFGYDVIGYDSKAGNATRR